MNAGKRFSLILDEEYRKIRGEMLDIGYGEDETVSLALDLSNIKAVCLKSGLIPAAIDGFIFALEFDKDLNIPEDARLTRLELLRRVLRRISPENRKFEFN